MPTDTTKNPNGADDSDSDKQHIQRIQQWAENLAAATLTAAKITASGPDAVPAVPTPHDTKPQFLSRLAEDRLLIQRASTQFDQTEWSDILTILDATEQQFDAAPDKAERVRKTASAALKSRFHNQEKLRGEFSASARQKALKMSTPEEDFDQDAWAAVAAAASALTGLVDGTPAASDTALKTALARLVAEHQAAHELLQAELVRAHLQVQADAKACNTPVADAYPDESKAFDEATASLDAALQTQPTSRRLLQTLEEQLSTARAAKASTQALVAARLAVRQRAEAAKTEIVAADRSAVPSSLANMKAPEVVESIAAARQRLNEVTRMQRKSLGSYAGDAFRATPQSEARDISEIDFITTTILARYQEFNAFCMQLEAEERELQRQKDRVAEISRIAADLVGSLDPKKNANEHKQKSSGQEALEKMVTAFSTLGRSERLKNSSYEQGSLSKMEERLLKALEKPKAEAGEIEKERKKAIDSELSGLLRAANQAYQTTMRQFEDKFEKGKSEWTKADLNFIKGSRGVNNNREHTVSKEAYQALANMCAAGRPLGEFEITGSNTAGHALHRTLGRFAFDGVESFVYHLWTPL